MTAKPPATPFDISSFIPPARSKQAEREVGRDSPLRRCRTCFGHLAGFDGVDLKFQAVNQRFDQVDSRLEKIERLILENHEQRLKRLEDAFAMPLKK